MRVFFGLALALLWSWMVLGAVILAGQGVYMRWSEPPIVACGVVEGPGDADGVVMGALWREAVMQEQLEQRYGATTLHLRTSDGRVVEVEPAPPSDASLEDEDALPDYRLLRIRPGDALCALEEGGCGGSARTPPRSWPCSVATSGGG
jgi:hypothetical protein